MSVHTIIVLGCVQIYDSSNGDLLLTLTNTRHLVVTSNQFVEVSVHADS